MHNYHRKLPQREQVSVSKWLLSSSCAESAALLLLLQQPAAARNKQPTDDYREIVSSISVRATRLADYYSGRSVGGYLIKCSVAVISFFFLLAAPRRDRLSECGGGGGVCGC